jgi:hypothetical protein
MAPFLIYHGQATNNMKNIARFTIILIATTVGLSSCVRRDYYETQPVGYQFAFNDDFNNDHNQWSFRDAQNGAEVYLSGGQLHYDYTPTDNGTNTVAVSTSMNTNGNFDIQTRLQSNNAMAMVFGVSASDYGYSVFIDDKGYYAVFDEGTASMKPQAIINWTQSSTVRKGWNDLELEAVGNAWIGYINGSQVFQIPARTLYGSQVGFMVLANTNGDADYLEVKW